MANRRRAAQAEIKKPGFAARYMADLHFHEWTEFATVDENGMNSRLILQLESAKQLAMAQPEDSIIPSTIIIAGDLAHKRGALTPAVVWAIKEFVDFLLKEYDQVIIIPGNHDYQLKRGSGWLNSLVTLSDNPDPDVQGSLWIYNEPARHHADLYLLPWMASKDEYAEAVFKLQQQAKESGERPVLVSHIAVTGARADNGWEYEGGIHPDIFGAQDFFPVVLLGDFHTRQEVKPGIHYIGAPYQMHWGDRHDLHRGCVDIELSSDGKFQMRTFKSNHPEFKLVSSIAEARVEKEKGNWAKVEAQDSKAARAAIKEGYAASLAPPLAAKKRLDVAPDSPVMLVLDEYMKQFGPQYNEMGDKGFDRATLRSTCLEIVEAVGLADERYMAGHLELIEVEAKNFFSYSKLGPLNLHERGVVLLDGQNIDDPDADSNGAGKSAIIEAIYYGLYGETLRDVAVDDLTKRNSTGGMWVRVKAKVMGGHILEVVRCRKSKDWPSGVTYTLNGAAGEVADPRKVQAELDRLTGTPAHLFKQIALFGQEVKTLFAASTDAERKQLLESLCASSQFAPLYAKAKEKLNEMDSFIQELNESRYYSEKTCQQLWAQLKDAETRAQGHSAEQKNKAAQKSSEAASIDNTAADVRAQQEAAEKELAELVIPEAVTDDDMVAQSDIERSAYKAATDCDQEMTDITFKIEQIEEMEKPEQGVECPTCLQKVSAKAMKSFLEKQAARMNELRARRAELEPELEKLNEEADRQVNVTREMAARLRDYNNACYKKRELEERIANLKNQVTNLVRTAEQLRNDAKEMTKRSANPWLEQVDKFTEDHRQAEEKLKAIEKDLDELALLQPYAKEAARLFGNQGLRTFLFDALAPDISTRANEALKVLASGTLQVMLSTETKGAAEKIRVEIDNIMGAPAYKGNSGGQKRKIDLAIAWAISGMVESKCNFLFIDEAFDALDSTAGRRVVELLEQRKETKGTIIITTHRQEFREYFGQVWTARLKDGESILEQAL